MLSSSFRRIACSVLVIVALVATAGLAGCAGQVKTEMPAANSNNVGTSGQSQMAAQGGMSEMTCAMCNKGAPAPVKGTATVENGVQVVKISLKDGYYDPNEIELKAGMPAKLMFTGAAKDCSGKPKIATLGKQVDFTKTGEATMELTDLKPGTYELTCGMGSPGGSVTVK